MLIDFIKYFLQHMRNKTQCLIMHHYEWMPNIWDEKIQICMKCHKQEKLK